MAKQTPAEHDLYEKAVAVFGVAVQKLQSGDFAAARDQFGAVLASLKDEPVLAERCRMYSSVCEKRLAPAQTFGSNPDELYYRAVVHSNNGNPAEAIKLLDQAVQQTPNSTKLLFARASAWALSANVEAAVNDLRQAIAIDPTIRFQAANDPDFEAIREEPGFIDIIEPTPTGV